MAKDKGPRFTFTNDGIIIVTDNRTRCRAEIYKQGNIYAFRNLVADKPLTEKRQQSIGQEMANWYYYTVIKGMM